MSRRLSHSVVLSFALGGIWPRAALVIACATMLGARDGDATRWIVEAHTDLPMGMRLAVEDLRADVARWGGAVSVHEPGPPRCVSGELRVAIATPGPAAGASETAGPLGAQEYVIREQRCGSGRRVVLAGGSPLAGQWAVYDLLQRLGIRYFHPEQTYYPPRPEWPATPIDVRERPAFRERSMHVHGDHPVDLSPPKDLTGLAMADYQRRWIDWNVKLRQTLVDGGFDTALVGAYAYDRGFPRVVGLNLASGQQGGRPVIDPLSARPEHEQISEAIDRLLAPVAGLPDVSMLTVTFCPSEFTPADEDRTVERLGFVSSYVAARHPGVRLFTINHGTHQEPVPKRHVRFFDLPQFAPLTMGVLVHPLMLYDLQRPAAGVYGNADFSHLQRWVRAESARRPIVYYPESSWWLTFDQAVPLFLAPATLEARQWDLDWLAPLRADRDGAGSGVVGHHLFTSGQEWGYWLIDYCVARMVWDPAFTQSRCLDDFTDRLASGSEIRDVLRAVQERQVREVRDPEILRFLVGSDREIETAERLGLHFHPLPPAPADVLEWDETQVEGLRHRSLQPLSEIAVAYHRFADRIEAVLPRQSTAQAPWVREIRDGLRAYALRAEHAGRSLRGSLGGARGGDGEHTARHRGAGARAEPRTRADRGGARGGAPPRGRLPLSARLTIAGDERGTPGAIANRTIYPYRYLSRTHRMFYWTRPDEQLAELVRAERGPIARADEPQGGQLIRFARGSLRVQSPESARRLEGLLPGLEARLGDDGAPFLELSAMARDLVAGAPATAWRAERSGSRAGPADLPLALGTIGDLVVREARVEVDVAAGRVPAGSAELTIRGQLKIDEVVDLMVKAGGFERSGARVVLAVTLGFLPGRLPDSFPIALHAEGARPSFVRSLRRERALPRAGFVIETDVGQVAHGREPDDAVGAQDLPQTGQRRPARGDPLRRVVVHAQLAARVLDHHRLRADGDHPFGFGGRFIGAVRPRVEWHRRQQRKRRQTRAYATTSPIGATA